MYRTAGKTVDDGGPPATPGGAPVSGTLGGIGEPAGAVVPCMDLVGALTGGLAEAGLGGTRLVLGLGGAKRCIYGAGAGTGLGGMGLAAGLRARVAALCRSAKDSVLALKEPWFIGIYGGSAFGRPMFGNLP
ncbi:hypothetical protein L211DRAFT_882682 [Terfezia boudieri ATCC MYA-4762]|uniref:Uncharacterized protein n=1 Tax=Terfezia boudieri ATCC MYA-4762 TaxID=1051890 RepID=A0A3N4LJV8_9PEZI|nr:hypothetical protein L211DRAFT_882682 [Terfezia boudieri ATCC MYA-4762]